MDSMYEIKHKETGEWLCGTDYNYSPQKQTTSFNKALLFDGRIQADMRFRIRKVNSEEFEVVKVELLVVLDK